MKKFESVVCAVCGSDDTEPISEQGQFGFTTHVCICKNCGLSYLNPRWDADSYLHFYRYEYDQYYRSQQNPLPPEQNRASYYPILKRLEKLDFKEESAQNILDIGSGDGSQLAIIMQQFPRANYYAIEPSQSHQSLLEAKGITFLANDVNTHWEAGKTGFFDLVIMRHVLEHFLDPYEILIKVRQVLKPNGLLYIAVPDAFNLALPLTDSFFRVVHTYYFNQFSIRNLLNKAQIEIIQIQEGDQWHPKELYLFAKSTEQELALQIDPALFQRQRKVYLDELKREKSLVNQLSRLPKNWWNKLVSIKKRIWSKPIIRS